MKTTKEEYIKKKLRWFERELRKMIKAEKDLQSVDEYENLFDNWITDKFFSQQGMGF